ncbi:restriction endonuclease [Granulosicoccus sp. 3-233]|uniref:restriction endonuclease n=1 Tax=Granulosicoccus sp. 3-233 TaxID=3417969 RepID=UPI003D34FDC8
MQNNPSNSPTWDEFLRPLLEMAEKEPITRRTALERISDRYNFSKEIRNRKLKSGQTQVQNRSGWAMSALVKAEFIEKHPSQKFTYQITDKGRKYLQSHIGPITDKDLKNLDGYLEAWEEASRRKQESKTNTLAKSDQHTSTPDDLIESATQELDAKLRDLLLENLLGTDPYHFEQIVVDVLVAMGYGGSKDEASQVTKKSNDGGIDGIINEDRLGLDVIYVQAKRWQNNIGRKEIQSFVGALAGYQAHKGIFITTSDFIPNAIDYAKSVSQKIVLIDGPRLADLMIEHNIGVSTVQTIEIKRLDSDYFEI